MVVRVNADAMDQVVANLKRIVDKDGRLEHAP